MVLDYGGRQEERMPEIDNRTSVRAAECILGLYQLVSVISRISLSIFFRCFTRNRLCKDSKSLTERLTGIAGE